MYKTMKKGMLLSGTVDGEKFVFKVNGEVFFQHKFKRNPSKSFMEDVKDWVMYYYQFIDILEPTLFTRGKFKK